MNSGRGFMPGPPPPPPGPPPRPRMPPLMPPRTMVYWYLLDLNRDLWFGVVGVAHEPAVDAGDERELREEVFVCFLFLSAFCLLLF